MTVFRVCIDCHFIFGCVEGSKLRTCIKCEKKKGCDHAFKTDKLFPDKEDFTGGICDECMAVKRNKKIRYPHQG